MLNDKSVACSHGSVRFVSTLSITPSFPEVTSSEDTELKYRSKHVVGLHEIGLTPYIPEEPNKCHIWTPEVLMNYNFVQEFFLDFVAL